MSLHWLADSFSPLLNLTFRRLFAAQVTSLFGSGLTTIALALLAFDMAKEGAGAVLGIALALKMLAYVVFAPVAAAMVEKISRRQLLVILDVLRALVVISLPWVSEIWQIYLLIFVLSLCSATFTPAFQALIPDILNDEVEYTRALSLSRLAYDLENILSPTIAALLLVIVSYSDFFVVNGLTFVLSALLLLTTALPLRAVRQREERFLNRLSSGINLFIHTPRLRALLAVNLSLAAVIAMQIVNTVVYVRAGLGLSEQALAWVYLGLGGGSVCGALLVPKLLHYTSDRRMMLSALVLLSTLLALGNWEPSLAALILLYSLMGFCAALVQTPIGNLLKRSSSEAQRPALFAAQFSLSHAGFLLCYPLAGWLSATFSVQFSYAAMALLALCSALAALLLWPRRDALVLEHYHPAQQHEHWHSHGDGHHNDHSHAQDPGSEPHRHSHYHAAKKHRHHFVIDFHHSHWPRD